MKRGDMKGTMERTVAISMRCTLVLAIVTCAFVVGLITVGVNHLADSRRLEARIEKTEGSLIAFQAQSLADTTPSDGDVMVYTSVVMNDGNGYDSVTGIFTAPIDGLYFFTLTVCLRVLTGQVYVNIFAAGRDNSFYFYPGNVESCLTATMTNTMTQGTTAFVRYNTTDTRYFSGGQLNSFSGFLVKAI